MRRETTRRPLETHGNLTRKGVVICRWENRAAIFHCQEDFYSKHMCLKPNNEASTHTDEEMDSAKAKLSSQMQWALGIQASGRNILVAWQIPRKKVALPIKSVCECEKRNSRKLLVRIAKIHARVNFGRKLKIQSWWWRYRTCVFQVWCISDHSSMTPYYNFWRANWKNVVHVCHWEASKEHKMNAVLTSKYFDFVGFHNKIARNKSYWIFWGRSEISQLKRHPDTFFAWWEPEGSF